VAVERERGRGKGGGFETQECNGVLGIDYREREESCGVEWCSAIGASQGGAGFMGAWGFARGTKPKPHEGRGFTLFFAWC
jgi:hypothetical protein